MGYIIFQLGPLGCDSRTLFILETWGGGLLCLREAFLFALTLVGSRLSALLLSCAVGMDYRVLY